MSTTKINARVDTPDQVGAKLTANALSVYFYYLLNSKRNPTGAEDHRYLYCKDVTQTQAAKDLRISRRTVIRAEQDLIEANYIIKDENNRIIYLPDSVRYVWLPISALQFFIHLANGVFQDMGLLSRLYTVLYYCRKEKQSFSARTWVKAFNMSETNSGSYERIHICLLVLKHYKLIDYDVREVRTVGTKAYLWYENVVVAEDGIANNFDDESGESGNFTEVYDQLSQTFVVNKETGEVLT